jgi:hypothetical protein
MRKIEDMFTPSKSVWRVFSVQEKNGFNVRVIDPNSCCILEEHQTSNIQFWGAFDSPGQAQLEQQKVWEILRNDNPPGIVKFRNKIKEKISRMGRAEQALTFYVGGVFVGAATTALQMALKKR